ncbi:MAG: hypothetical protein AAGB48_09590 [Planctomycetota bacterium]
MERMNTRESSRSSGRTHTALLTAVAVLLAADMFVRLQPPAATASEAIIQPERSTSGRDVPTLVNPATQRSAMLKQLQGLNQAVTSLERRLSGPLEVKVTNFPRPEPQGD